MAERNNAYCAICGNPYYVCMSCLDSMRLSPWKIHTDTSEHFKVYQVIHGFTSNIYNKDEAKAKLKNIDLRDMESFRPNIKEIIKDILKEENPIVQIVEESSDVVASVAVEDVKDIVKPAVPRKKNYKVNNKVVEAE